MSFILAVGHGSVGEATETLTGHAIALVMNGDICAALIGEAREPPIPDRYAVHQVPTASVSTFIITEEGWFVLEEGQEPAG